MYNPTEIAIYIHWPYCRSKCPYCDFYKEVNRNQDQSLLIEEYIEALRKYRQILPEKVVKSIFFGGGTPSLIKPENIAKIIDTIADLWQIKSDVEISLEANPNTRYQSLFYDLKLAGINRLSLGVQALNDEDLRFLGRTHNLHTARQCLHEVVAIFDNHSADLIYARPQQQLSAWEQELAEITAYGLKHISLYQLTIEDNTIFKRKNIQPLDDENAAIMYDFTRDYLAQHKYNQYEVSNFAVNGYESIHNLTYWQGGDYIGIGKSAHGRLFLNQTHIATVYPFLHIPLTPQERAEELLIMGLRLTQGINKRKFKEICGLDFREFINQKKLQNLQELGLITETTDYVKATKSGFLLLNQLIIELCTT